MASPPSRSQIGARANRARRPESGFGGWVHEKSKTAREAAPYPQLAEPEKNSSTTFDNNSKLSPAYSVLSIRLKVLCAECGFENPAQYKHHSFRHHFASMCANDRVAYRKALAWLGHSSSDMLDLYYHLHDEDSHNAMMELAKSGTSDLVEEGFEDSLRTVAQSKIAKNLQPVELQELIDVILGEKEKTERAGFDLPSFCKLIKNLYLLLISSKDKDLSSLCSLLSSHDFLLF